ncbi:hypothetical protein L4D21_02350 [Photobacterium profundum]|uniref:prenylated flavin chaperone LpdD n=1 Tax=Photobacterium profundum TaxID=74109 RepID=UPI003D110FBA
MIKNSTIRNKKLTLNFTRLGKDINVSLYGGEVPHIGAISIGHINNAGAVEVKSYGLPTHKEKDIAEYVTKELTTKLNCTITLSCGIHFKDIAKDEISLVLKDIEELKEKAILAMHVS